MDAIVGVSGHTPPTVFRSLAPADAAAAAVARAAALPTKGQLRGVAARAAYDGILSQVPAPPRVRYQAENVGGCAGWWCVPEGARADSAILYLHGGWFSWGTSAAYRHFAGHVAAAARRAAFVPDYRLAPEHPFPAGAEDALRCFDGLAERGWRELSIAGDSAGGNLALGLAARLASRPKPQPTRVVALSPVTDLSFGSPSWDTRAEADPYFTREQAEALVSAYLAGHDATDPLASPLHGAAARLPPLRIHVGDAEVLLDDSLRYVQRAAAAGVDARVDVWRGMPHVFLTGIDHFAAARLALAEIGAFLAG
jgi:monoterpene epsilon-lactone hydrolase